MNKRIRDETELNFVSLTGGESEGVKGELTMPSQRLDDPGFKYVPACATDIRETINRARKQMTQGVGNE